MLSKGGMVTVRPRLVGRLPGTRVTGVEGLGADQYCKVVRFVILVRIRTNLVRLVRYVRFRTKLTTGIAYMDITNLDPAVPKREWSVWCL